MTNLLNMRELEDEGKVMALADYASPIDDGDNPLLALRHRRRLRVDRRCRAAPAAHACERIHWRYPNEQFAFMAQRVRRTRLRRARAGARSSATGERRVALAGGVVSNIKATRRVRLLPEVEDVYVFPHMGDGGLAVGAALWRAPKRRADRRRCSTSSASGLRIERDVRSQRALDRARRVATASAPDIAAAVAEPGRRRPRRAVVAGPDGVRPARARPPQRAGAARSARRCAIG